MKPRILFVIPTLTAGGAERVMSFLASKLNDEKFKSTLVVIGSPKDNAYSIESVEVIYLHKKKVRFGFFPILRLIRKNKYDVVFSSLGHLNTMAALWAIIFKNVKFIGRETLVRSKGFSTKKKMIDLQSIVQRHFLDFMVCQSDDMYEDMLENFGFDKRKLVIINNPVSSHFQLKSKNGNSELQFITVGRLSRHKGHERILRGLKKLDFPFRYLIIGSGMYEGFIMKLVRELCLEEKVMHIPFTKEIPKHLSESHCFLSGSYVEGFPNALIESCAVGTPVVAFDAPGGINEIIIEDVNGFIVNTPEEFVDRLHRVAQKDWNISKVRESVVSRYSEEIILTKYENLIARVLEKD